MVAIKSWRNSAAGGALMIFMMTTIACSPTQDASEAKVTVYKAPWCGCCSKWVDHLHENGFAVVTHEATDATRLKLRQNIGWELGSCHTAIVDGYVIEGHVPADVIKRFLEERPPVVGLTVPGMPLGSPGMEGAYKQPYEILTFDRDGKTEVYAKR
jgi:hypothetical protein